MKKLIHSAALAVTVLALPLAFGGLKADAGGFVPLQENGAWDYGSYRVAKLAFSENAVGPFNAGDATFVAEPEDGCAANCQLFTLTLMKGGTAKAIPHVPASAFSAQGLARNDGRLVFAGHADDTGDRYDVVEVDPATGDKKVLASGVFAHNASMVTPVVSGKNLFLELGYGTKDGFRQQATYFWDPSESVARTVVQHFVLNREEIQDAMGTKALVKMSFPSGNQELWLMDSATVDARQGSMKAIPGTWTDPGADIVGAHFLSDGTVEYFRNYVRNTWRPGDAQPTAHASDTLTWFRPAATSFVTDPSGTTWIDAEDVAHKSDLTLGSRSLGLAAYGRFQTSPAIEVVGEKQVTYHDLRTGVMYDVGTGSSPVVDETGRAYWRGSKGGIYSAVLTPGRAVAKAASVKGADGHFVKGTRVKFDGRPTVFVVGSDLRLSSIPDEATAQLLFGSDWNKGIVTVTDGQMIDYPLGGVLRTADDLAKL